MKAEVSRWARLACWLFDHRDVDEGGGRHVRIIRCSRCKRLTYTASATWMRRRAEERARARRAEPER